MKSQYCKNDCGNLCVSKDDKGNILGYTCTADIKWRSVLNSRGKPVMKKYYIKLEVDDGLILKTPKCLRGEK